MPSDIDPQSGFRLPLPNREDLDEIGKAAYDRGMRPGATMMGLQGPAGIQLYTKGAPHLVALNQYLRFKSGITPRELPELARVVVALPRLQLRGLMCIPDPRPDFAEMKAVFARARDLFDALRADWQGAYAAPDTLSMGMSADLEAAIAAGSTMVRVGSALFGARAVKSA